MYFLDGDRIYIKPENGCGSLNAQVENCLSQLLKFNSKKKIFKLNFFVDTASEVDYQRLVENIKSKISSQFSERIIQNFIAQPPLTCKIIVEAFFYDASKWKARFIDQENNTAMLFTLGDSEIMVGNIQSNENKGCWQNAEMVFTKLSEILNAVGFPKNSIIRQWNYIENILGFDGKNQRYQEFNNARTEFYSDSFDKTGYPAATGIGMNRGGVIVEFVAVKSAGAITSKINNPEQQAAHNYSKDVLVGKDCVLKSTPKFERARYFELFDKKMIFISGTASIEGEQTVKVGDPVGQTEVTIKNIKQLYSNKILNELTENELIPKYGHARVYLKNRKDFAAIKKTYKKHFGNLPVVYIIADICREDLLVEIEGKVILE